MAIIIDYLKTVYGISETIALLAACYSLIQRKASYWQWFIVYLLVIVSVEVCSLYLKLVLHRPNFLFHIFLQPVYVLFFSFIYYHWLNKKTRTALIGICAACFIASFSMESVVNGLGSYNKITRIVVSLIAVVYAFTFFFQLLKREDIVRITTYPPFWITTGILFHYLGTVVVFSFYTYVSIARLQGNEWIYTIINGTLNVILYGCWSVGFLCKRTYHKSSGA